MIAIEMEASVIDICSHAKKVRSFAKNTLGSILTGTLRGFAWGCPSILWYPRLPPKMDENHDPLSCEWPLTAEIPPFVNLRTQRVLKHWTYMLLRASMPSRVVWIHYWQFLPHYPKFHASVNTCEIFGCLWMENAWRNLTSLAILFVRSVRSTK